MGNIFYRIFLLIWFIVWPFSATFQAIHSYAKKIDRKMNFFLIFLFFGLYGYVTNAVYDLDLDLMRIYKGYDLMKDLSFGEALPYILSVGDLSYVAFWGLGQLGFSAQVIGFLSAGWFYSSWLLLISTLYKGLSDKKIYFILLVSFLLFIANTYPLFFSGVRSSTGTMLVMLGLVYLFQNRTGISLGLLCLASLFHFSFAAFLLLWMIYRYGGIKYNRLWIILFIVLAGIFPWLMETLCNVLLKFGVFGALLVQKIQFYTFEYQNGSQYTFVIAYGSGWRFIANLLVFATALYVRLLSGVGKIIQAHSFLARLDRFIWLFMAFLVFISYNDVMLGRFFTILVYLCIIFLVSVYLFSDSLGLKKLLYLLVFLCSGLSLMGFYREFITGAQEIFYYTWKIFIQDIFSILSTTVEYK